MSTTTRSARLSHLTDRGHHVAFDLFLRPALLVGELPTAGQEVAEAATPKVLSAAGPGEDYGARHEATVTFIDRNLNLVHLDDGTELRARDSRLLERIHEGMRVVVDVTTADLTPSTLD